MAGYIFPLMLTFIIVVMIFVLFKVSAFFKNIFLHIPKAFIVVNKRNKIVLYSLQYLKLLNQDKSYIFTDVSKLICLKELDSFFSLIKNRIAEKREEFFTLKNDFSKKLKVTTDSLSGSYHFIHFSIESAHIMDKNEKNTFYSQNNFYYQLCNRLPRPIIVINKAKEIILVSQATKNILKISPKKDGFINALTDEGRKLLFSHIENKDKNQSHEDIPLYFTNINKEIYFSIIPEHDFFYLVPRQEEKYTKQMSKLKDMQSQKLQAMGELAGGIAHDFNNLLTAMIGFCDLLLSKYSPSDQSFTDIMQIKQNANRAASLTRQLLAFSRQQTLKPEIFQVSENIEDLMILLNRLIGPMITLKVFHSPKSSLVKIDKVQFEQVIINLAVNARDSISGKGLITITVRQHNVTTIVEDHDYEDTILPGEYLVIDVEDTGSGIEVEHISRIFDPFFSTKGKKGTGLGLSTVYGIIKQMGGGIFMKTKIGQGTTFSIYIPLHVEEKEVVPVKYAKVIEETIKEQPQMRDLTGSGKILLVEDEDAVRIFSSRALREKGYDVVDMDNPEKALSYIENPDNQKHVNLLITDVTMPNIDGLTLVQRIQKFIPHLKVIYISGYAEDIFRKKVNMDTSLHYLPKPFSLKSLAFKVREVLEQE